MSNPVEKSILIVDAVPENVQLLQALLGEDYRLLSAGSGEQAWQIARGHPPPDLILLGNNLLDIAGFELLRRLKHDTSCRQIPVIIITDKDSAIDESRGFELGAIDYIIKPFDPHIVKLRVGVQVASRGDILHGAAVLSRELKLQQIINTILLSLVDSSGLQKVLESLCKILNVDFGYLVFIHEGMVINTDFYSLNPLQSLKVSEQLNLQNLSRDPLLRSACQKTLVGQLDVFDSVYIPLLANGELIGCLELGSIKAPIKLERYQVFVSLFKKLQQSFKAVYDSELKARLFQKTRLKLNETESLYRRLLDDSNDLIISFRTDGSVRNINPVGAVRLGYSALDPPASFDLMSPEISFLCDMLGSTMNSHDIEVIFKTRQGEVQYGLASMSADLDDRLQVVTINAIIKDMTEHIEFQQKLWQANIDLSSANELLQKNQVQMVQQEKLASIGELAAGIAHEINNPLAFVSSNHQTMEKYFKHLSAYVLFLEAHYAGDVAELIGFKSKNRIEYIQQDIELVLQESNEGYARIMSIVKSLKDFSRVDASGNLVTIDLNEAIRNTLVVAANLYKYVAKVETDFQLQNKVECFGDQINQVLLNLVVNSAQALESQHRKEMGLITIQTWEENGQAHVECRDNGPGIPDNIKNRIFEPFFTTKEVGQGTGLGLSITNDIIVNKHQGHIKVEDNPGGGTRFIISIPLLFAGNSVEMKEA